MSFTSLQSLASRQRPRNLRKLRQSRFQILHDLRGNDVGRGKVIRVLQRLVAQPEDVQGGFVAGDEFLVGERAEALGLGAFVAVGGVVGGDEVVEVGAGELAFFEREAVVGAEIVDPFDICPILPLARFP